MLVGTLPTKSDCMPLQAYAEAEELREQVRDLESRLQEQTALAESTSAEQVSVISSALHNAQFIFIAKQGSLTDMATGCITAITISCEICLRSKQTHQVLLLQ